MTSVSSYECRIRGLDGVSVINAPSRGLAKAEAFASIRDVRDDIGFTDVSARKVGPPVSSQAFLRTVAYRGIPHVRCGDQVTVGEDVGVIVGHNDSANLEVIFYRGGVLKGPSLNVHPRDCCFQDAPADSTGVEEGGEDDHRARERACP